MYELKTLEEFEEAIDYMFQETDASMKTKHKHLLLSQFRKALDKIGGLERTNARLRSELETYPEYNQRKALESITAYTNILR